MAHNRLPLPPAWLSIARQEQHRHMRKALLNTCEKEFHTDHKYSSMHGGLFATSELKNEQNKEQTLFQDMVDRLQKGEYGQQSELALIACKYNVEIIGFRKWHSTMDTKTNGNPPTKARYCPQVVS